MKLRLLVSSLVAFSVLLVGGQVARAQINPNYFSNQFNPLDRPALSPYLNLLRGGNPAANYYLGVLPERQRRLDAALYGEAIQDLYRREQAPVAPEPGADDLLPTLPQTGHWAGFQVYTPFYA